MITDVNAPMTSAMIIQMNLLLVRIFNINKNSIYQKIRSDYITVQAMDI